MHSQRTPTIILSNSFFIFLFQPRWEKKKKERMKEKKKDYQGEKMETLCLLELEELELSSMPELSSMGPDMAYSRREKC